MQYDYHWRMRDLHQSGNVTVSTVQRGGEPSAERQVKHTFRSAALARAEQIKIRLYNAASLPGWGLLVGPAAQMPSAFQALL